jgi:hypothetical protein
MRDLHAHHAAIHDALDVGRRIAARAGNRRDADRVRSHRHHLDIGKRQRAVLAIKQHPVEARMTQHLDDLRRREHHRAAKRRLAGFELCLHQVWSHAAPFSCLPNAKAPL